MRKDAREPKNQKLPLFALQIRDAANLPRCGLTARLILFGWPPVQSLVASNVPIHERDDMFASPWVSGLRQSLPWLSHPRVWTPAIQEFSSFYGLFWLCSIAFVIIHFQPRQWTSLGDLCFSVGWKEMPRAETLSTQRENLFWGCGAAPPLRGGKKEFLCGLGVLARGRGCAGLENPKTWLAQRRRERKGRSFLGLQSSPRVRREAAPVPEENSNSS